MNGGVLLEEALAASSVSANEAPWLCFSFPCSLIWHCNPVLMKGLLVAVLLLTLANTVSYCAGALWQIGTNRFKAK